jgi:cytochrome oxidase Cu insertion factor (SCO1/SenC/PrrC family)/copper(I)-binding protein
MRRQAVGLLTATVLAVTAGCLGSRPSDGSPLRGVAFNRPLAKPSVTLTRTDGRPFDLARDTDGKVALLFFGYTHCPDVCPLHMANIAAVLQKLPWEERSQIQVLFVTADPERDTPARLAAWLANFDPSFIGLTGTPELIAAAQRSLGLREAQREYPSTDSTAYSVAHAAQVFAFSRDGFAYLAYPFGTRQEDWAHDLPILARDVRGDDVRRALAAAKNAGPAPDNAPSGAVAPGGLAITRAVVAGNLGQTPRESVSDPNPEHDAPAAAYFTVQNGTPVEDTLVAVAADLAGRTEIHETMGDEGMRHMMPVRAVPIPPRTVITFAPGGRHVMLFELRRPLAPGDSLTLYLSFARLGAVTVKAPVVTYADVERALR